MTDTPLSDEQHAAIRARHNLNHDPDACGTCRKLVSDGKPAEHPECARRPFLIPAPDMPDWEDMADLTDEERQALPARFHIPGFESNAEPNAWLCQVCWGDGWVTRWPCKPAVTGGRELFAAQHHAERARWDGARLLAEVDRLRAERDQARAHLATAQRQIGAVLDLPNRELDDDPDPEDYHQLTGYNEGLTDVRDAARAAADAPHPN